MKTLHALISGLTLAVLATTASAASDPASSVPDSTGLKWQEVAGTQGAVSYANVEGDLFGKGPYSAFVKFRKGTDNGLHRHTQSLPTVVLAGTFYALIDGQRVEYPAGGYYRLPAGQVHESGCTAATDCLLFQYQDDAFDLVPVKG